MLAAALALIVHGFLLSLELDVAKHQPLTLPKIETLTLTFPQVKQARQDPFPSTEPAPYPTRSSVPSDPSNEAVGKTSPKKKSGIAPDRYKRAPISSKELSKTMIAESRAVATAPGIEEEVVDRERLGQTEDAAGLTGENRAWKVELKDAQASAGAGSGEAIGKGSTGPFSASIREATPAYRANPSPEYPAIARRRGYEGTVLVEVLVSRDGRVEDLRLSQSSGYPILDQAAMTSIKGWLFEPATVNREKVDMWVKVPVLFHLK